MNTVIKQLKNRRSIRQFTGETVNRDHLEEILRAAQQAPTSTNGQQISLVVIEDKNRIQFMSELVGGKPQVATADVFIVIVADFYRPAQAAEMIGGSHIIQQSAEGILVGAVDAGIMLNAIQIAAESFGYGTTAIGAIRRDPEAVIEALNLPPNTYPMVATTIGVIDQEAKPLVKPRVLFESFVHFDKYHSEAVQDGIKAYNHTYREWWDEQGLTDMSNYSEERNQYYTSIYFDKVAQSMEIQGFRFQDKLSKNSN
jgi:FMN reductase [NAD(P)H]